MKIFLLLPARRTRAALAAYFLSASVCIKSAPSQGVPQWFIGFSSSNTVMAIAPDSDRIPFSSTPQMRFKPYFLIFLQVYYFFVYSDYSIEEGMVSNGIGRIIVLCMQYYNINISLNPLKNQSPPSSPGCINPGPSKYTFSHP